MRREHLAHLLRAASKIANDREIVVIGSQAILGSYDEDDLPDAAVASIEADFTFWDDPDNAKSDLIDGILGEDGQFHATYGYYAQGVDLTTATLPHDWRARVVIWQSRSSEPGRAHCLDPHDLAVSKLVASREKDHEFVAALLDAELLDPEVLLRRCADLLAPVGVQRRVTRWVRSYVTARERRDT
ncbi:hypothetical protein SAMN06264364_101464 [Quadrisphaera granulorum]|uniref:DUF6036 domain-containing protein n=1 Tax=Quadrisphaera granulorum TaxID=317664 RepID=A0A316AFC3_9ACTN|nr:DUF6036 family nucleotidyltransferase [Quadrisphaera granulorum]PWJ56486.1 hypothetical protein BXY45_101464 [Quadrisphaera granulorum]SZE95120.1 hypothetical protein SAMN06264364_101464 [Quadrisphaera granulorum]